MQKVEQANKNKILLVYMGLSFFCLTFTLLAKEARFKRVQLAKFASKQDVAIWDVRKTTPATVFELSKWPDNLPGKCVRIVYPKYADKGEQWPAVILTGENLPVVDWSPFESLSFEVFSKTPAEKVLNICLFSTKRMRGFYKKIVIKPGLQTITVPLADFNMKYLDNIKEFHLYMTRPKKQYELFIGDIFLKPFGDLQKKASLLLEKLSAFEKKISKVPPSRFTHALKQQWREMINKLPECHRIIENAANNTKGSLRTLAEQQKNIDKTKKLLKELSQLLSVSIMCKAFPKQNFAYGWLSSLEKVYRDNYNYKGSIGGSKTIELAKNEKESAQLVLLPFMNLKNVKVTVKAQKNREGKILPASCLKVAPVGYVKTNYPIYFVDRIGWHPDPILEYLESCQLDACKWQSFWIEVTATKNQKPGLYPCVAEIAVAGAKPVRVPFYVRIYDFSLQYGSRLPLALSAFSYTGGRQVGHVYLKNANDRKVFEKFLKNKIPYNGIKSEAVKRAIKMKYKIEDLLMDHRLTADNIYRRSPPTVAEVKRARARGVKNFCIVILGVGRTLKRGDLYPKKQKEKILKMLAEWVPKYKMAGVLDMAYIYGFDEASDKQFAAIKDIFGEIKKRYPEIKIMTTAYDDTYGIDSGLDKVIDIWVPLTQKYGESASAIAKARARGRQVWWYVCCQPRAPYANWFIEYPAIDHRLVMGYMPYKYKSEGFLYYCLAMWRKYENKSGKWIQSWRTRPLTGGPLTDWAGYSWRNTNGDGNIIYPGTKGPVASIRLKNICDGLEDYIYLKMLEDAVREIQNGHAPPSGIWLKKAQKCLQVSPKLVKSLTEYSLDGEFLLKERAKLAALLEEWTKFKRK